MCITLFIMICPINQELCRYYYQYQESRLSACPAVLHGMLHIPQNIRECGPVWTTWTFHLERFCGILQGALRSQSQPWANLNNRITQLAYLGKLGARYDLEDELRTFHQYKVSNELSRFERDFVGCESSNCAR